MKHCHCDKCKSFFSRFKCNSPDECDCPVCQGMCECHQETERNNATD